jgi:dynactin complex subunit
MSLYQGDTTSMLNCFNNIVPISMEYILFGCNEFGEEFNTLLFKSVLKRAMSTILSDFLNFSPKLEQM